MKALLAIVVSAVLACAAFAAEEEAPTSPPSFPAYEVEGVGTVIAHEGDSYHVRTPEGKVIGFRAQNGEPSQANAAADIAHALANPPAPPPPREVTRRQLFLALNAIGVTRAAIRAQLEAIPDETVRENALIDFDEALTFERTHPLVAQLAAALGLTSAQADNLFRDAATR